MIRIVNWPQFQHFRDRKPIWIKLYRELLHKKEWRRLSGDGAKLLVDLWMLAAEANTRDGVISTSLDDVAYEIRIESPEKLRVLLQELVRCGFVELISDGYQDVRLEVEVEREEETDLGASGDAPPNGLRVVPGSGAKGQGRDAGQGREPENPRSAESPTKRFPAKPPRVDGQYAYPPEFEEAWAAYPRREGSNPKVGAYQSWQRRVVSGSDPSALVAAARHYQESLAASGKEGTEYVQQASRFFGPSEPWLEFVKPQSTNGAGHWADDLRIGA